MYNKSYFSYLPTKTYVVGTQKNLLNKSHTFVEIDHEIISMVILLPSTVSFKRDCCLYVHEVYLVNRLFKLAQEKSVVSNKKKKNVSTMLLRGHKNMGGSFMAKILLPVYY